jgi:hypothetical protein
MNGRLLLLLLLGASFLFFGCAKKGEPAPEAPGTQLGPAGETTPPADDTTPPAEVNDTPQADANVTPPAETNETDGEDDADDAEDGIGDLADLFQIDTDKPLEDEGFDTSTPESKE